MTGNTANNSAAVDHTLKKDKNNTEMKNLRSQFGNLGEFYAQIFQNTSGNDVFYWLDPTFTGTCVTSWFIFLILKSCKSITRQEINWNSLKLTILNFHCIGNYDHIITT